MNSEIAKQRLSEVVRIDTITSSYGDFMATHVPFRQIQLQKEYDSSAVSNIYRGTDIQKGCIESERSASICIGNWFKWRRKVSFD